MKVWMRGLGARRGVDAALDVAVVGTGQATVESLITPAIALTASKSPFGRETGFDHIHRRLFEQAHVRGFPGHQGAGALLAIAQVVSKMIRRSVLMVPSPSPLDRSVKWVSGARMRSRQTPFQRLCTATCDPGGGGVFGAGRWQAGAQQEAAEGSRERIEAAWRGNGERGSGSVPRKQWTLRDSGLLRRPGRAGVAGVAPGTVVAPPKATRLESTSSRPSSRSPGPAARHRKCRPMARSESPGDPRRMVQTRRRPHRRGGATATTASPGPSAPVYTGRAAHSVTLPPDAGDLACACAWRKPAATRAMKETSRDTLAARDGGHASPAASGARWDRGQPASGRGATARADAQGRRTHQGGAGECCHTGVRIQTIPPTLRAGTAARRGAPWTKWRWPRPTCLEGDGFTCDGQAVSAQHRGTSTSMPRCSVSVSRAACASRRRG